MSAKNTCHTKILHIRWTIILRESIDARQSTRLSWLTSVRGRTELNAWWEFPIKGEKGAWFCDSLNIQIRVFYKDHLGPGNSLPRSPFPSERPPRHVSNINTPFGIRIFLNAPSGDYVIRCESFGECRGRFNLRHVRTFRSTKPNAIDSPIFL